MILIVFLFLRHCSSNSSFLYGYKSPVQHPTCTFGTTIFGPAARLSTRTFSGIRAFLLSSFLLHPCSAEWHIRAGKSGKILQKKKKKPKYAYFCCFILMPVDGIQSLLLLIQKNCHKKLSLIVNMCLHIKYTMCLYDCVKTSLFNLMASFCSLLQYSRSPSPSMHLCKGSIELS